MNMVIYARDNRLEQIQQFHNSEKIQLFTELGNEIIQYLKAFVMTN